MAYRKPHMFWDFSWTPVSGCNRPRKSPGCANCWTLKWLNSHTWKTETVYTGAITTKSKRGRRKWTGVLTALRAGDPMWNLPLTHPGVVTPALGDGKPNLIFCAMDGDLFATGRPKKDIDRVCVTVAYSRHYGLLCTKNTPEMVAYFGALDPRTVRVWQPKLWLGFSAENQDCFNRRWPDIRPLAEVGWFVWVSISPMLGPVILPPDFVALRKRTWVIVNGECEQVTREECRPMDADWARAVRDQCRAADIPFFMRAMHTGAYVYPDLQIRQFPSVP